MGRHPTSWRSRIPTRIGLLARLAPSRLSAPLLRAIPSFTPCPCNLNPRPKAAYVYVWSAGPSSRAVKRRDATRRGFPTCRKELVRGDDKPKPSGICSPSGAASTANASLHRHLLGEPSFPSSWLPHITTPLPVESFQVYHQHPSSRLSAVALSIPTAHHTPSDTGVTDPVAYCTRHRARYFSYILSLFYLSSPVLHGPEGWSVPLAFPFSRRQVRPTF